MGFFSPKDGAAKIEADLRALEKRRAVLQSRLGDQVSAAQRAAKVALDYLVTGDDDQAKQRELEEAARDARRAADSIAAALTEIDSRIEDATRSLTSARDSEVRERRAAEMEAAATTIAKRAKALEAAAEKLAVEFNGFFEAVAAISDALHVEKVGSHALAAPGDIARAVLSHALAHGAPDAFEHIDLASYAAPAHVTRALVLRWLAGTALDHRAWGSFGEEAMQIEPATAAAEKMLVAPLRAKAAALRAAAESRAA